MRYTHHRILLSYKKDKVLLNHLNMGRLKHIILSQDRYSLIRVCNIKTLVSTDAERTVLLEVRRALGKKYQIIA